VAASARLALQKAFIAGPERKYKTAAACQAHLADPYEKSFDFLCR